MKDDKSRRVRQEAIELEARQAVPRASRGTRKQIGAHLRALGWHISDSILDKLCAPSVAQGPPPECWWGGRPLYNFAAAEAWARARARPACTVSGDQVVAMELDPDGDDIDLVDQSSQVP